jgi:CCR4-NOT transcriptional complex subunit CAF120
LLRQQEQEQQRQAQLQQQQYQQQTASIQEQSELPTSANVDAPPPGMFRTTSRQQPGAAQAPSVPSHSRTSSTFSLFKSKQTHSHTASASSNVPQTIGEHGELPRNDHGHRPTPSTVSVSSAAPLAQGNGERPQTMTSLTRTSTSGPPPTAPPPPLHPEIRSIVQLTAAHSQKVYFSGQLIRHYERQPDGQRPLKDDDWRDVFGQLGGTTLSLWDMKEIEEASKQGRQVPPAYINVTDAVSTNALVGRAAVEMFLPPFHKFIQVLGSVTIPASATAPSRKYTNVFTLNTAGSNLLLFACPSTQALLSWAAALRLAAWEKSRLEEIYSAHLIRITLDDGTHFDRLSLT